MPFHGEKCRKSGIYVKLRRNKRRPVTVIISEYRYWAVFSVIISKDHLSKHSKKEKKP